MRENDGATQTLKLLSLIFTAMNGGREAELHLPLIVVVPKFRGLYKVTKRARTPLNLRLRNNRIRMLTQPWRRIVAALWAVAVIFSQSQRRRMKRMMERKGPPAVKH